MNKLAAFVFVSSLITINTLTAGTYPLPINGDVVGETQTVYLEQGQSLVQLARDYEMSYYEILEANPNLNPNDVEPGTAIFLPSQFILPDAPREGVVFNIAEPRMYFYPEGKDVVITKPVGIGRQGWTTPTGTAAIKDMRENPYWTAPISVRKDMAKRGVYIPPVMPPGPENPLGSHAMRITMPGYVIHGTNRPDGVGRRSSAGCLRLYPEDIKDLFEQVEIGTPVHIVDQPFKSGWSEGQLYFEAHRPLRETREKLRKNYNKLVKASVKQAVNNMSVPVQWHVVKQLARTQNGLPQLITPMDYIYEGRIPQFAMQAENDTILENKNS